MGRQWTCQAGDGQAWRVAPAGVPSGAQGASSEQRSWGPGPLPSNVLPWGCRGARLSPDFCAGLRVQAPAPGPPGAQAEALELVSSPAAVCGPLGRWAERSDQAECQRDCARGAAGRPPTRRRQPPPRATRVPGTGSACSSPFAWPQTGLRCGDAAPAGTPPPIPTGDPGTRTPAGRPRGGGA